VFAGLLLGLVEVLSKIKDVNDLLAQERLKAMISFLEKIAEVQIKTAIEELRAMPQSTRPEEERSRAIGQLKIAANALVESLEKRPFLYRLLVSDDYRKMQAYLQITGCYLIVTSLYLGQYNMMLARQYAIKAALAFDGYSAIRQPKLQGEIAQEFVGVASNDQAVHYFIYSSKLDELISLRVRYGTQDDAEVFWRLAGEHLDKMRAQLFGWLAPLELN
jgi:hypothetical protein